jgi:heme/copper-type cytochrome/quinol oxidase subunit 3
MVVLFSLFLATFTGLSSRITMARFKVGTPAARCQLPAVITVVLI